MNVKILLLISAPVLALSNFLYSSNATLHLKNNSADSIQIDIMQNNKTISGLKRVAKGGELTLELDINKPTTADIHYCPTATYCKTNLPDKMTASFKPGKTIYVKFDGKKVAPQKGNPITGKTTAGYSTKNNVAKADISVKGGKTSKTDLGVGGMYKQEMPQSSKETVEKEAWKYFGQDAQAKKKFGWNSNDLAFAVLGLDMGVMNSYTTGTYDERMIIIKKAYDKKTTELNKIKDLAVKNKALEIAEKGYANATAYMQKLKDNAK